jgi:hypothetical protein
MKADVNTQTVEVLYDPAKTTPEALAKAITEHSGFEGSVKSAP